MSLSAESSFTERIFQSLVFVFRLIIKIIKGVFNLFHPILLAGAPKKQLILLLDRYEMQLHTSCDYVMQNFEMRQTVRKLASP